MPVPCHIGHAHLVQKWLDLGDGDQKSLCRQPTPEAQPTRRRGIQEPKLSGIEPKPKVWCAGSFVVFSRNCAYETRSLVSSLVPSLRKFWLKTTQIPHGR